MAIIMDFDQIIVAHSNWKKRFVAHLEGKEKLVADVVAKDNVCDFGKWLYGEGRAHANRAEYLAARDAHAAFHKTAATALSQAAGVLSKDEALALVGLRSDYSRASANCIAALTALRDSVNGRA
ncbi:MAG: CZB domain-containing protein [Bryobacterales bacterium]|nr:CZB domain-containing protein [Bryobacterales bacterium]